jgi:predicted RNA-binding protein Jag
MSDDPRPEDLSAEGEGDSLGEAKWAAMKELEPRFPGITAESVSFEVVEEPEGGGSARVRAEVDEDAWRAAAEVIPEEPGERVRAIVGRVVHALGLRATVDIEESEDEIRATVNGDELGLLIGKHGTTIDACTGWLTARPPRRCATTARWSSSRCARRSARSCTRT